MSNKLLMLELAGIILTHLIVASLAWVWGRSRSSLADIFRFLVSTPRVDEFEKILLSSGYKKYPAKHSRYFVRERLQGDGQKPGSEEEKDVRYLFFIQKKVEVQEFMAFLLPSIDFGHGHRRGSGDQNLQVCGTGRYELWFDEDWDRYLHGIGLKIKEASKQSGGQKNIAARRVIFFDRNLLSLFIFENDWIFRQERGSGRLLGVMVEDIIQYAFDVLMIHRIAKLYEEIECRYVAESAVIASECYDFGLYKVDGVRIVYAPIYLKDGGRTITRREVLIGNTSRQRHGIDEFVEIFEKIWESGDKPCNSQQKILRQSKALGKVQSDLDLDLTSGRPVSRLFERDYFEPNFFELVYCEPIAKILKEHGFEIPEPSI